MHVYYSQPNGKNTDPVWAIYVFPGLFIFLQGREKRPEILMGGTAPPRNSVH